MPGTHFAALTDAVALSDAVRAAVKKVDLNDTLIIVTADHSHTFVIQGYPIRGNNILGLVRELGPDGTPDAEPARDKQGKPYTTLGYINGPGARSDANGRPDISTLDTTDPNYLQEAEILLGSETHGGEDVAIFATGPNAYLIRGSMEENWIFYVIADAMRLRK